MSNFSIGVEPSVQFLSVFTYMNILSDILYLNNFLQKEEQHQSFPIINALYEYLEVNETKELVQQLLRGTNFYGGAKNESLDEKYIDATLEYIVTKTVFSQYGNIYGYLAKVISSSNNLNPSYLRIKMYHQLDNVTDLNENGTISHLSDFAKLQITRQLLWPLFPRPQKKMKIIDIDYIYAQAGLMLSRLGNFKNLSFQRLILMALPIETMDKSFLQVFFLPALLYYAHKERGMFRNKNIAGLISDQNFWVTAFDMLFSHLNRTIGNINQKIEKNTLYQFQFAMAKFKTRTNLAREILFNCYRDNGTIDEAVKDYKTYPSGSYCFGKPLENLNEVYTKQISEIKNKYYLLLRDFIQVAFDEANVTDLINSSTVVVGARPVPIMTFCYPIPCGGYEQQVQQNVSLISVRHNDKETIYAIILGADNITLLNYHQNRELFVRKLGLLPGTEFEAKFWNYLKNPDESFLNLKNRIAEEKAKYFSKQLHAFGYEETRAEHIMDILLGLIPFYNCVKYSKNGEILEATLSCFQDVVIFLPLAGQLSKILFKLSDVALVSTLRLTGTVLRTMSLRNVLNLELKMTMGMMSSIVTKKVLRSLALSVLDTMDPGFRLFYKILPSKLSLQKVLKNISKAVYKFPVFRTDLLRIKSMWRKLLRDKKIQVVIGKKDGHDIFRYAYRNKPYGIKYIRLSNQNAELRQMIGFKKEVPVVVSRTTFNKVYYRRINLLTEQTEGIEWTLKDNLLHPVRLPFREHITKIVTEGLSGKRKLKVERRNQFKKAMKIMTEGSDVSVLKARSILQRYMLTVKHEGEVQLEKVEPINFGLDFDVNDPNTLKKYLGDYKPDVNLNEYFLSVPTYEDFARDFISGKSMSTYDEWLIPNSKEMTTLIYNRRIDFSNIDEKSAFGKISTIYGDFEKFGLSTKDVLRQYDKYNLGRFTTIGDLYSIMLWVQNDHTFRNLNEVAQLSIQMALYKLTVAMVDEDHLQHAGVVFWVEMKDPLMIHKEIEEAKRRSLITNRFMFTTSDEKVAHEYLNVEQNIIDSGEVRRKIPVLYEMNLRHRYLVSNVNTIVAGDRSPIAVLPNMEFDVMETEKKFVAGKEVYYVKMCNRPINKEVVLLKIAQNIQTLGSRLFELSISKK